MKKSIVPYPGFPRALEYIRNKIKMSKQDIGTSQWAVLTSLVNSWMDFSKKEHNGNCPFVTVKRIRMGRVSIFLTITKYITNLIIFSLLPLGNQWHGHSNWAGGSDHNRFRIPNLFFPTVTIVIYLSLVLLQVPKFHVRPLIQYTEIYLLFFHNL